LEHRRVGFIPDPTEHPTVPLWPIVGMAFGKKRSAILELARQGKLPVRVFKIGGSYRVPTAELLTVLGQLPQPNPTAGSSTIPSSAGVISRIDPRPEDGF
jgi:hypothetical protein